MNALNRILERYCKMLDAISALFLLLMVILVFGNVVLRYGFNSGLAVSEEVSRWLFVWITFLGSIVAMREHQHLGTDMLVSRLPTAGKKACLIVSLLLMLYVCWLLFSGSVQQTQINWDVTAPSSGASVAIFYATGIVFAVSAGLFILIDLYRVLTGQIRDEDLVMIQESEEAGQLEEVLKEVAGSDAAHDAAESVSSHPHATTATTPTPPPKR
jgi:TRAP-type C4-dicarboxylate transport system permease small subunit